ncbi:hypothetical protein [Laspinema olomoucense]|uniref:hypothetical protein n=1 Tax=Laspinema olomoucense TaxID=3231600 RepID=UPI0021BB200A|nr:hypothetical protein [Laspinema sp. D3c]MCT7992408.1 hypothetical protein [Laspinema sp. D3c]
MYPEQTKVTWESASQGSRIRKTGIVLRFIPAYRLPTGLESWLSELKPSQLKFNPSEFSKNDRYLVKVVVPLKRGGEKDVYYAPRASVLTKVD